MVGSFFMEVKKNMEGQPRKRVFKVKRRAFNDVYWEHLTSSERYQIYYGGAGSGKSRFVAQKLILKLLSHPEHKLLVVRKTYATHLDSTFEELTEVLKQYKILGDCRITKAPLTITLPNQSKIIFKGTDEETKLLSISGITLVWVEEAYEITRDIFEQLTMRLRGGTLKKEFYLTFNPISEDSWLKEYFFDGNKPEDTLILKTTYKDNKFLDAEYIEDLERKKETNPHYYFIYALGNWGTYGKTVFTNWEERAFNRDEIEKLPMLVGMDFGFTSDPTTLVQSHVDEQNKIIYVSRGFYQTGLHNSDIADYITEMGLSKSAIIADSAEPKSISELQRLGIRRVEGAVKGRDSVRAGIARLQEYQIIVHPELDWFISELQNYSYKKDRVTGNYTNEPVDKYNHGIDAFRYSLQCMDTVKRKGRVASTMTKKQLRLGL